LNPDLIAEINRCWNFLFFPRLMGMTSQESCARHREEPQLNEMAHHQPNQ
jgi:hypothetical protein